MVSFRLSKSVPPLLAGVLMTGLGAPQAANAQSVQFGRPYHEGEGIKPGGGRAERSPDEHLTARGHRAPPKGYIEAPDVDFKYGPDPGHFVERDKSTGANIQKFGSAYQESNPMEQGTLGDATGNGWTAPRGNGW